MTESESGRPITRLGKRRAVRLFGEKPRPTPEELAARNAAMTARKIRQIFALKEPRRVSN
jgi:hypothetical protein